MTAKLITLEAWAEQIYGEHAPHIGTLRRWARDGKIVPAPRKQGRTYYVSPAAEYADAPQRSKGTLLNRLKSYYGPQTA